LKTLHGTVQLIASGRLRGDPKISMKSPHSPFPPVDAHVGQRHVQSVVVRRHQDFQGALHQPRPLRALLPLRLRLRLRLRLHLHFPAGNARKNVGGNGQVLPRVPAGCQEDRLQGCLLNVPFRVSVRPAHSAEKRAAAG